MKHVLVALSLAVAVTVAAANPVLPALSLSHMAPEHSCLFLCEMCLQGAPEGELMQCVNKMCGRITAGATCGPVLDWQMLWLGSRCHDIDLVMQLVAQGNKKH